MGNVLILAELKQYQVPGGGGLGCGVWSMGSGMNFHSFHSPYAAIILGRFSRPGDSRDSRPPAPPQCPCFWLAHPGPPLLVWLAGWAWVPPLPWSCERSRPHRNHIDEAMGRSDFSGENWGAVNKMRAWTWWSKRTATAAGRRQFTSWVTLGKRSRSCSCFFCKVDVMICVPSLQNNWQN